MYQRNLNYPQDLIPESLQCQHLPQLAALLDNIWFKHFIAVWLQDRDRAREAVCTFPVHDMAQLITMLQTRGEASTYEIATNAAYIKYSELLEEIKENERAGNVHN